MTECLVAYVRYPKQGSPWLVSPENWGTEGIRDSQTNTLMEFMLRNFPNGTKVKITMEAVSE